VSHSVPPSMTVHGRMADGRGSRFRRSWSSLQLCWSSASAKPITEPSVTATSTKRPGSPIRDVYLRTTSVPACSGEAPPRGRRPSRRPPGTTQQSQELRSAWRVGPTVRPRHRVYGSSHDGPSALRHVAPQTACHTAVGARSGCHLWSEPRKDRRSSAESAECG
jgi:hypothetical protein